MRILITGDFVITDDFMGNNLIDNSVEELFKNADYRIVNLEAPVTRNDPKNRILKTGPHLRVSHETSLLYLKQLKVDMVTLANNHVLDYGQQGLMDTLIFCDQNRINYVGAGPNLREARVPKRFDLKGNTISIINIAENEWASAKEYVGGAHPIDIIENAKLIQSESKSTDFVIVVIHGGHEYYNYPSPRMKRQYQFFIDQGANVVIGHHPHCISGYEYYNESPIIYSLGNFIFTKYSSHNDWYEGLICCITIDEKRMARFELIPVIQNRRSYKVSIQAEENRALMEKKIEEINSIIRDEKSLENKWDEFIHSKYDQYYWMISPFNGSKNKYAKAVIQKLGMYKIFMSTGFKSSLLNTIRCEAHKDALISILSKDLKN